MSMKMYTHNSNPFVLQLPDLPVCVDVLEVLATDISEVLTKAHELAWEVECSVVRCSEMWCVIIRHERECACMCVRRKINTCSHIRQVHNWHILTHIRPHVPIALLLMRVSMAGSFPDTFILGRNGKVGATHNPTSMNTDKGVRRNESTLMPSGLVMNIDTSNGRIIVCLCVCVLVNIGVCQCV
jgi:hypothetical protein